MGASGSRLDQTRGNTNAGNGVGALSDLYNKMAQNGMYGGQQSMMGSSSSWGRDMDMQRGKGGGGATMPGTQADSGLGGMRMGINPPRRETYAPGAWPGGMMNRQIRQGK